jgi:hypothetical protein
MTGRLGRRSGAALALLTVLLVTVPASPAAAAALVTIDSPRAEPALTSAAVSIAGSASSDSPLLYMIKSVKLAVGSDTRTVECAQQPCRFSWSVNLPLNGPYQLKATATETLILGGLGGGTKEATRSFSVAAPPARPAMDKPTVTDGRNVDLSWSRNTEGDMLYYALFRRDPGSSSFNRVGGNIPQKSSGKITFSDTTTSAFNGGEYSYQVVAVRKGASGTADTEAKSEPSGAGVASVPPPPTTSTSAPAGPGVPGGAVPSTAGPTTTVKPGSAGGVDLSGFLSSRPPAVPLSPITIPEPPDTGFNSNLPFGPGEELEEGEAEAVPPRDRTSVISRLDNGRPLVPVAGGLVLLLLALHMRLLNRRIKAADEADLPVDPGTSVAVGAPEPPPAAPPAPPRPAPTPALYDVVEEEAWDEEEWAPPAVLDIDPDFDLEPEPQPAPVLAAAPLAAAEPAFDPDIDLDFELEDDPPAAGPLPGEEIEVFEVVSPAPRRLARAGSR